MCAGSVQASLCVNGVCGASDGRRLECVRVEGNKMRGEKKERDIEEKRTTPVDSALQERA